MSESLNDDYDCIGGEGWYMKRCSSNFVISIPRELFSETPPIRDVFRDGCSIRLGNAQNIRMAENERKECYDFASNFVFRASSGIIRPKNDSKYELSSFQELSMIVHTSSPYEEVFIRRNAVMKFLQRIMRSAQVSHASLRPAYPGSLTCCTCGNIPHYDYCPLHDIYDNEKAFLYPELKVGDRVIKGPDWQWGNQGEDSEGTVCLVTTWKGIAGHGIRVQWDNGDINIYRYGGENCYDVIECNPMLKVGFTPQGGYDECSECFWSNYVKHYLYKGVYTSKGFFAKTVSRDVLLQLLPDFCLDRANIDYTYAGHAISILKGFFEVLEKDYIDFIVASSHSIHSYTPQGYIMQMIQELLFPYQVYLFSQAEGDTSCKFTESIILEGYLIEMITSSLHIITKCITRLLESDKPLDVLSSLYHTIIGQLLPYALSMLYIYSFSQHIILHLRSDVEDVTLLWVKLLKLCKVSDSSLWSSSSYTWRPLYDAEFQTDPVSLPWYLTVLQLLVSVNSRYHYSPLYCSIIETREDVRTIIESYAMSGGLQTSNVTSSSYRFLLSLFNNELHDEAILYRWLDSIYPEPEWKRKHQPVAQSLEMKLFCAYAYACGYESQVMMIYNELVHEEKEIIAPKEFKLIWRYVINTREHLRSKKQEFSHLSNITMNRSASLVSIPSAGALSFPQVRSDSSHILYRHDSVKASKEDMILERRIILKRLLTCTELEKKGIIEFPITERTESSIEQNEKDSTIKEDTYEDYVDYMLQKLELLMKLSHPLGIDTDLCLNQEKYTDQPISDEKNAVSSKDGSIPSSKEELICSCVWKLLFNTKNVPVSYIEEALDNQTRNAKARIVLFNDAFQFLHIIEDYPQAVRLFLLGLSYELAHASPLSHCGFHTRTRKQEGLHTIDILENCEGASCQVISELYSSFLQFCDYTKKLFERSIQQQHWEVCVSILWFLSILSSPKLPYLSHDLDLPSFLIHNMDYLNNNYMMVNGYSKEILVSPGVFWDSLCQKEIALSASHFHTVFEQLKSDPVPVNPATITIPGIFPIAYLAISNAMRLTITIIIIQQFTDYSARSLVSPAQNRDSLYHWTLTDMSNLFLRVSPKYKCYSKVVLQVMMRYFSRMQQIMRDRCDSWQPFAPISYRKEDTSINMYTCVKRFDEKNIMRGMIATDMLISAAEGAIASYLALLLFVIRTKLSYVLKWNQYGDLLWNMVYFSPRHQKLATMLLQVIIPQYSYIPPVFEQERIPYVEVHEGTAEADSILHNPLLSPPFFPEEAISTEKKKAFVYYLLHLASHSDGCPAALVGERNSCSLCCGFFPFIYNLMCKTHSNYAVPNKALYLNEVVNTDQKIFVSTCHMHIRPDGHTASFCSLVFAEEVVYLLREMMNVDEWLDPIMLVFAEIFAFSKAHIDLEDQYRSIEAQSNHGFHVVLRERSPLFCMMTAVLKVLGAITPRMYAGCRIRIHDYLMEGENDVSTLIHTAYQSHGTGSIIKYHRSMGEALVLLDKIETPLYINTYSFDVVDRVAPPRDSRGLFSCFLESIMWVLQRLVLSEDAFTLPADDMPFFNTEDLDISPYILQNHILHLYCVRCINHIIISNETLTKQLSTSSIQFLMSLAIRPLPCKSSFNTLIIRQYFNWFIEYLIDTYPASARLLPMELQTEVVDNAVIDNERSEEYYGEDKGEDNNDNDEYNKPIYIRSEGRMRKALSIQEKTGIEYEYVYRVLESLNDDEDAAFRFIISHSAKELSQLCDQSIEVDETSHEICDSSVLTDMELGISSSSLLLSAPTVKPITSSLLSTLLPPFTSLQKVSQANLQNHNSIYGVVASVTDEMLLYSPFSVTGVITAIKSTGVTLSILNANSGILEEDIYPADCVSLHKHRLLYYLSTVRFFRGVVCRIASVLSIKYIRELLICCLSYIQQQQLDAMLFWNLKSTDVILMFKFTYVAYRNSILLNTSKNTATIVLCLFRLFKSCLKNLMLTSKEGVALYNALKEDVWSRSMARVSYDHASLSIAACHTASSHSVYHCHSPHVSGTAFPTNQQRYHISSLHPCVANSKYYDRITIPGAEGLRIVFDKRCCLEDGKAHLTFFRDDTHTQVIARFTGDYSKFYSFTVYGNTLRLLYENVSKTSMTWGYGFLVEAYDEVKWSGDPDVILGSCFDWNCYALGFILDTYRNQVIDSLDYYELVFDNLLEYIRTSGMPFKARVIELLTRLLQMKGIKLKNIGDSTGIYTAIIDYCNHMSDEMVIPSQLPLLIEFVCLYNTYSTPLATSDFPMFQQEVETIQDTFNDTILAVYSLSSYFNSRSYPSLSYLCIISGLCHKEWNVHTYSQIVDVFRRFHKKLDMQLLHSFDQKCLSNHISLFEADVNAYVCDEDDRARYYGLSAFSNEELRLRLMLIQYFNQQLRKVIPLIELGNYEKEKNPFSLGYCISLITGYIFPSIKEDFLKQSIKQTVYHGNDSHIIVELDNRRVFTELERSELQLGSVMDDEGRNAVASQCTFAQLYREMKKYKVDVMRADLDKRDRLLAVRYKGEQGLDWGGLYRDAIERCVEDLFSDRIDLFIPSPNFMLNPEQNEEKFIVNPKYRESTDALAMYTFVGNLIGVSLRTHHLLNFEFNSVIWKTIVGDCITMEDINRVDSSFVTTMNQIRDYKEEDGKDEFLYFFGVSFCVEDSAGNLVELIPSGSQIAVTYESRLKYVELASEYRLNECRQVAEAIAAGVYALVPQKALSLFTWNQLQKAVIGETEVDITALRQHTVYVNCQGKEEYIAKFWRVMNMLSSKDKSQFIRFVWARSRLPKTGNWSRPFKLCYKEREDELLPVAHTCFFQLELPDYESDSIMKERLLVAIHFGSGEFMLR